MSAEDYCKIFKGNGVDALGRIDSNGGVYNSDEQLVGFVSFNTLECADATMSKILGRCEHEQIIDDSDDPIGEIDMGRGTIRKNGSVICEIKSDGTLYKLVVMEGIANHSHVMPAAIKEWPQRKFSFQSSPSHVYQSWRYSLYSFFHQYAKINKVYRNKNNRSLGSSVGRSGGDWFSCRSR